MWNKLWRFWDFTLALGENSIVWIFLVKDKQTRVECWKIQFIELQKIFLLSRKSKKNVRNSKEKCLVFPRSPANFPPHFPAPPQPQCPRNIYIKAGICQHQLLPRYVVAWTLFLQESLSLLENCFIEKIFARQQNYPKMKCHARRRLSVSLPAFSIEIHSRWICFIAQT